MNCDNEVYSHADIKFELELNFDELGIIAGGKANKKFLNDLYEIDFISKQTYIYFMAYVIKVMGGINV